MIPQVKKVFNPKSFDQENGLIYAMLNLDSKQLTYWKLELASLLMNSQDMIRFKPKGLHPALEHVYDWVK